MSIVYPPCQCSWSIPNHMLVFVGWPCPGVYLTTLHRVTTCTYLKWLRCGRYTCYTHLLRTHAPPPFVTKENCVIGKCAYSLAYCACKGLSEALCFGWLILRRQYLTFPWIIQEIFSSPILELIIHSLSHYLHFFWISVVTGLIVATNLMHHIRIRNDVTFSSYCMSGIYGLNYVVAR